MQPDMPWAMAPMHLSEAARASCATRLRWARA